MEHKLISFEDTTYLDIGTGQPIVILHGLFGSLSNFDEIINSLKSKYRIILPILPLYSCDLKEATIDGFLSFIHRFISNLNLKNFVFLGNSLGGHLALKYVLVYPEEVKSIILTGSSGLFENSLGNSYPKRDRESIREKIGETFGDLKHVTEDVVDNVIDIISSKSKLLRILSLAKSATRQNLNYELKHIHKPTLLIWGLNDKITPPFVAEQFKEKIENSELYFIDNCGHAPMMEQPEAFLRYLNAFLLKQEANS